MGWAEMQKIGRLFPVSGLEDAESLSLQALARQINGRSGSCMLVCEDASRIAFVFGLGMHQPALCIHYWLSMLGVSERSQLLVIGTLIENFFQYMPPTRLIDGELAAAVAGIMGYVPVMVTGELVVPNDTPDEVLRSKQA